LSSVALIFSYGAVVANIAAMEGRPEAVVEWGAETNKGTNAILQ
jgi:hypothetical protein